MVMRASPVNLKYRCAPPDQVLTVKVGGSSSEFSESSQREL